MPTQTGKEYDSFVTILHFVSFILGCVGSSLWAFSSCGKRGLLLVAVRGLLIAVASLVAEHGSLGFSSCGLQALECRLSSCGARG